MRKNFLKKMLSTVLVLTLVIAMMPVMNVFAEAAGEMSGVRIEYPTYGKDYTGSEMTALPSGNKGFDRSKTLIEAVTYGTSFERVEWLGGTATTGWQAGAATIRAGVAGQYGAYKIRVPKAGKYLVNVQYRKRTDGGTGIMYIIPGNTEDIAVAIANDQYKVIDGLVFSGSSNEGANVVFSDTATDDTFGTVYWEADKADEYIVVWKVTEKSKRIGPANLILDGCGDTKVPALVGKIELSDTELVAGENAEITAKLYNGMNGTAAENVTYRSSDSSIISVEGTTVTAKKAGEAILYAEAEGFGNSVALDVTVAAPADAPTELTENVIFAAGAAIEYKIGDGQYTTLSPNVVESISVGSEVTVKANDVDNFAGWVRGTENSKNWISNESEYTFTIMSHTYLTPVYTETEETDAQQVVEFWNENKEYLGSADVADGKATAPVATLTGHSFSAWHLSETDILPLENGSVNVSGIADAIIRAVAKHNAVNNFGKTIPNSNASATYWKRGDDIVAYGTSYDFYKWSGDETITYGTDAIENKPLIVLDSTPVDGAYMIEYDKGNALKIVEAGIIFGGDDDIVIGSTDGSKAASQRNGDHGQFCAKSNAKSNYDYARGYLIYKGTDNKLYVIYTAAVATIAE